MSLNDLSSASDVAIETLVKIERGVIQADAETVAALTAVLPDLHVSAQAAAQAAAEAISRKMLRVADRDTQHLMETLRAPFLAMATDRGAQRQLPLAQLQAVYHVLRNRGAYLAIPGFDDSLVNAITSAWQRTAELRPGFENQAPVKEEGREHDSSPEASDLYLAADALKLAIAKLDLPEDDVATAQNEVDLLVVTLSTMEILGADEQGEIAEHLHNIRDTSEEAYQAVLHMLQTTEFRVVFGAAGLNVVLTHFGFL